MSESGRISPIWTVLLPPGKKKRVISLLSKQRVLEAASIFPQNGPEGNEKKNIRKTAEKRKCSPQKNVNLRQRY